MFLKPPKGGMLNRGHILSRGLAACWLFNENGGYTVFDVSGNGHHGTINASYTWAGSIYGPTIQGDNTNTHCITAACPQNSAGDLAIHGGGTVIVSANLVSDVNSLVGRDDTIWIWTHTTNNRLYCRINSDNDAIIVDNGTVYGSWHTYALTYDDSQNNGYAYRDGAQIGSVVGHGFNMTSSAASWYIGEDPRDGSGLPLNGKISHVYIYNRVLNSFEIMSLYREPFQMFWVDM